MLPLRIALRYLLSRKSHGAVNIISAVSMAGVAVGFVGLLVLAGVCSPFDKKRFAIWISMAALLAANILLLGRLLYSLVPLGLTQLFVLFLIMGAAVPCLFLIRRAVEAVLKPD